MLLSKNYYFITIIAYFIKYYKLLAISYYLLLKGLKVKPVSIAIFACNK